MKSLVILLLIASLNNRDTKVAGYNSLEDSMDSFKKAYGNIVRGTTDPEDFAQKLKDNEASKFGRRDNGDEIAGYAAGIADTADKLVPIIDKIRSKK